MEIKLIASSTFTLLWLLVVTSCVHLIESLNGIKKSTDKSFRLFSSTKLPITISHRHHNQPVNHVKSSRPVNHHPSLVSSNTELIAFSKYKRQGKDIFDGWGYHHHPDKDEDISKTFSYLMPILLLIAAVTLTMPIIALFFFIFLWKRPPAFLCNVLDPELKNTNNLNAQPRVYSRLMDLLLTVDKAFTAGDHHYGP